MNLRKTFEKNYFITYVVFHLQYFKLVTINTIDKFLSKTLSKISPILEINLSIVPLEVYFSCLEV